MANAYSRSMITTQSLYCDAAMPKAEPVLPLNCPNCLRELAYVVSTSSLPDGEPDTHFYNCPEHGGVILLPKRRFDTHSFTKLMPERPLPQMNVVS